VDKKLLHQALQKLSARERLIMELRFGLKGGPEKTQKEVADLLGISQSYISRLEKRIIKRLRREIKRMECPGIKPCPAGNTGIKQPSGRDFSVSQQSRDLRGQHGQTPGALKYQDA